MGSASCGCCSGGPEKKRSESVKLGFSSLMALTKIHFDEDRRDDYDNALERVNQDYLEVQSVSKGDVVNKHYEFPVSYAHSRPNLTQQINETIVWPSIEEVDAIKILRYENLRQSNKIKELELEVMKLRSSSKRSVTLRHRRRKSELQVKIESLKDILRTTPIPPTVRMLSDIGSGFSVGQTQRIDDIAQKDKEEKSMSAPTLFTRDLSVEIEQERKHGDSISPRNSGTWSCSELKLL